MGIRTRMAIDALAILAGIAAYDAAVYYGAVGFGAARPSEFVTLANLALVGVGIGYSFASLRRLRSRLTEVHDDNARLGAVVLSVYGLLKHVPPETVAHPWHRQCLRSSLALIDERAPDMVAIFEEAKRERQQEAEA